MFISLGHYFYQASRIGNREGRHSLCTKEKVWVYIFRVAQGDLDTLFPLIL